MSGSAAEAATIPGLVEAQVDRTPRAVAVVEGERSLTFAELDARANQLASFLQDHGVGPDVLVGICMERTLDMAVGLLAILKAGGACLPLDPAYPGPRLAFMLEDSAAPVLLTSEHLVGRLPTGRARIVRLDADWPLVAGHPDTRPQRRLSGDDLAYVIYTSGSTGEPKGVMLPHRALVNHHRAAVALYQLAPGDRILQFCSISFDVSVEELFPTWASGATVVLRPDDAALLGRGWVDWLRRYHLTVMNLPTGYWQEWVRDLSGRGQRIPEDLRLVIVGGDRALGSVYRTWLEVGGRHVRWINAYGPTEASVMATVHEPSPPGSLAHRDPPIGRPLPNVTVHLLDERRRPVDDGEAGEMHIGGAGLARGYLHRPELTADRFVPDPFSGAPGARLYRTGDLARMLPGGELEFVGRLDDQVKVRGFRIECGEVEAALMSAPDVAEAVVVAREDAPGDKRLVAYTVPGDRGPASPSALRRFLSERLPGYMVPSAFVSLDAFPLSPNGKLDRDALPVPARSRTDLEEERVAPRTPAEEALADIWAQVLGLDELGVHDDFFDLGGHSLLATQVVSSVEETFGVPIPLRTIFEAPTVAGLAAALEAADAGAVRSPMLLVPQERPASGRLPLSLPQRQMWALENAADPPGLYNVTAQHRFKSGVEVAALEKALLHLVERHETLRTSFATGSEGPFQQVAPSAPVDLAVFDLSRTPAGEREAELRRRVGEQDAEAFDLGRPPLFRARLYDLGEGGAVLAATFDHLISDGTSAYVFLSELAAAYDAHVGGRQPELRPLAVQYADFALWQERWLTEERLSRQFDFWKEKLAGMPLGPAVPFDRMPDVPSRHIATRSLTVDPDTYRGLVDLARDNRATVFVVCVAAVQAQCSRLARSSDVMLSTTLSGRQRAELEGLIGFFAGVGRMRTDLSGDPGFSTVVARARETVLGMFEHQDIPFMKVRDALLPDFPQQVRGRDLLAILPTELQYFHAAHDEWAPGFAVVERPGPDKGPYELYFRGQLHPLSITLLDDGTRLWGECNYKTDFYVEATIDRLTTGLQTLFSAVAANPELRLSELPG